MTSIILKVKPFLDILIYSSYLRTVWKEWLEGGLMETLLVRSDQESDGLRIAEVFLLPSLLYLI